MICYLISYDLHNQRQYGDLIAEIRAFPHTKVHASTWMVVTDLDAHQLYTRLAQHIDEDDSLFVLRSGRDAAWSLVEGDVEWLHRWL
ncbi:MAG: hypothetical protein H6739_22255 [Alphaproteobacteria bacterium]|nr:hypothetical protein [Alphaproteobacteria bacterium]